MATQKKNPESKVTIEDLLALKRHEKPSADFWNGFDQELRRKTLQTFARQQSITERVWQLLRKASVVVLPTGALAAAVLGVVLAAPVFTVSKDVREQNISAIQGTETTVANALEEADSSTLTFVATSDSRGGTVAAVGGNAQFVVDAYESSDSSPNYRKVRALENFQSGGGNSARYVADHLLGGSTIGVTGSTTMAHF